MATRHKSNFKGNVLRDGQRQKKVGSSYLNLPKGIKMYNAEEGVRKISLDFLPYIVSDPNHPCKDVKADRAMVGNLWWRRPFKIHRNVGSDTDTSTVICPTSIGKKCPICDFQKKRFAEGAPKEETKELYPKPRNLYIVVPIDQKDYDETPHIWDMSQYMFQDILVEILEEDDTNEVFPSLEEGKTLDIRLKWDSIGERGKPFPAARDIRFEDREPYDEKILDEVPDLDKVLNVLSYEELTNKFFELEDDDTGGELTDVDANEEISTSRRRRTSEVEKEPVRRRRRSEPELKDDDKDEGKPKSFRRSRKTEDEPDEKSRRASERRRRPSEAKEDERCTFGHKFGVDTETFDDCDKCEIWGECIDEKEGK